MSFRMHYYLCKCDCGTIREVNARNLIKSKSKCCGCEGNKRTSLRVSGNNLGFKHGFGDHPLRSIRKAMLHRCYNENNPYYYTYGERGIEVCEEWKNSLENFISWALSSGWKKGLSIDRIDNNMGYEPKNCQWITVSENSRKNCILGKEVGKGRKKRKNFVSIH